ncbi:MAG TPA: hypothetical protein VGD80_30845, partial [Kofleriaceae bacterium]
MRRLAVVAGLATLLGGARSAAAESPQPGAPQPGTPVWAEGADVVEHLGQRLPLDLGFVDAGGQRTQLRSLFDGVHPV